LNCRTGCSRGLASASISGSRGFDVSAQQLFWAAPRCLSRTAADGSGATCIDTGNFDYASPRADENAVYVIRDIDIVRLAR